MSDDKIQAAKTLMEMGKHKEARSILQPLAVENDEALQLLQRLDVIAPKQLNPINIEGKNRIVASLLAIFLGGLGIHKFYLGQTNSGILYLVFCWTFIPAIVGLIEGVMYLGMSDEAFAAKFD